MTDVTVISMTAETLKKTHILSGRKDFERLFREGRRLYGNFVYFISEPAPDSGMKIAFICGRRIGNAVVRNRCKRLLREVVRKNKTIFNGRHTLIIALPTITHGSYAALCNDILTLAQKFKTASREPAGLA